MRINRVPFQAPTLLEQFERRQAAFQANLHVQDKAPSYRITGIELEEYTPPSADNSHEMVCFDVEAWRALHGDPCSVCSEYANPYLDCGTVGGEYDNAWTNLCDDITIVAGTLEYDNADMQPRDYDELAFCRT